MLEEPTRIDVHHHWFPDAWLEVARRDRSTPSLPGGWSADADLATMDALGIQAAVLSITAPGVFVGDGRDAAGIARRVNDEGAQVVATRPDRYGFFATLPLPDVDASVAEISRALGDLGAEGVALMTSVAGVLVSDPRMRPVWAELDRRRAVVLLHPSPGASTAHRSTTDVGAWIDFPTETTRAAAALVLGGVLREFPSVSVILPHAGGFLPYQSGRFEALAALRAVDGADDVPAALRSFCFDTSLAAAPALRGLLAFADPRRVLFGTDLPAAPPAAAEYLGAELDDVFADTWSHAVGGAPLGEAVNRENALRLLPHLAARIRGDRTEEGSR